MKSEKEIRERLREIENTEQIKMKPANIQINAPLALIQIELESKRDILKWVLQEGDDE